MVRRVWTPKKCLEIRGLIEKGLSHAEIGRRYGVSGSAIAGAVRTYKIRENVKILKRSTAAKLVRKCFCGAVVFSGCNHCGKHLTQILPVHQISLKFR